jgi:hypothetical protein
MITTIEDGNAIDFFFDSKKYLGYAYREADGYYVFENALQNGFFTSYSLRMIADKLDELNKEWDEQVKTIK